MICRNPITTLPSSHKCLHVIVLEPLHPVILFTLPCRSPYAALPATNTSPEQFTGYLSLTILELNIYTLYQRSQLFCTEWYISTLLRDRPQPETHHLQLRRPPLRQHHVHKMQTMRDGNSSPHKPTLSTLLPCHPSSPHPHSLLPNLIIPRHLPPILT